MSTTQARPATTCREVNTGTPNSAPVDDAQKQGWSVVITDTADLDMSTSTGRLVAGVLARAAAFERGLIRARTKEALAAKRPEGVRLGRPQRLPVSTLERIVALKADRVSLHGIATRLSDEGVPTAGGGK